MKFKPVLFALLFLIPFIAMAQNQEVKGITSPADIDFSRVGYHYGEDEFPDYSISHPNNIIFISPKGNGKTAEKDKLIDRTQDIQEALNNVKKPGTVVLLKGRYYVSGHIKVPGRVILRGETSKKKTEPRKRNLTTIISTMQDEYVDKTNPKVLTMGFAKCFRTITSEVDIVDEYVSEGSMSVNVSNSSLFRVGDEIIIRRPDQMNWRKDLGMDVIVERDGVGTKPWNNENGMTIDAERIITKIEGQTLYFENPLPMALEAKYGGGKVCLYKWNRERFRESGVEYINFDSFFDPTVLGEKKGEPFYADENHNWTAVCVSGAQHCWVKGITATHFAYSAVAILGNSKNITVEDCHSYEPVSLIKGRRRYAFSIGRAQLCLVKNCTADKDRHQFVTTMVNSIGPHVFVDCSATNSYSNAGPHAHWATSVLYDNIKTDELLSVEDAYYWGAGKGQGWQGANHVFWNCEAESIVCQNPQASARNWAWGCIGKKRWGSLDITQNEGDRPDGEYFSHGTHITPRSLYYDQLEKRKAAGISLKRFINWKR